MTLGTPDCQETGAWYIPVCPYGRDSRVLGKLAHHECMASATRMTTKLANFARGKPKHAATCYTQRPNDVLVQSLTHPNPVVRGDENSSSRAPVLILRLPWSNRRVGACRPAGSLPAASPSHVLPPQ